MHVQCYTVLYSKGFRTPQKIYAKKNNQKFQDSTKKKENRRNPES